MHRSTSGALALLLRCYCSHRARAHRRRFLPALSMPPPWSTGLSSTCAISARTISSARNIDGYRAPALPAVGAGGDRAGRGPARSRGARTWASKCSTAIGRNGRSHISCAGRAGSTTSSASPSSIPTSTSACCSSRAISPSTPVIRAARPSTSPWFGARDGSELDMGSAVRLLQPEIMALGQERERAGAKEPRAAGRGDDARRVSALRQGMVALHAGATNLFPTPISISRCVEAKRAGRRQCEAAEQTGRQHLDEHFPVSRPPSDRS